MNLRRLSSVLLVVVLTCSLLSGCSQKQDSYNSASDQNTAAEGVSPAAETPSAGEEAAEMEPVTISIGNWPTPDHDEYNLMEGLKQSFEEKYPYITIVPDEFRYEQDTFLAKAASGQLPNLVDTWFTETEKIIKAGYAQDITETLEKHGILDSVNPDLWGMLEMDGRYYGIPVDGYSMSMMYNVDLFKEAGLVDADGVPLFPETWDELAQTAVTIKEKTGKAGFFFPTTNNHGGWMFMNIAWSYGAEFETLEDGKWVATFDTPEAVAALKYLKDLKWKYDVLQPDLLVDLFEFVNQYGTGQAAMGMCQISMCRRIVNNTGMSKDNFAVSTLPAGPAGSAALIGGNVNMFAPGTTPEQMDAIMLWLDHCGDGPVLNEEDANGLRTRLKEYTEAGYPVGAKGMRIWTNPERTKIEDEIYEEYKNVDMKLWNQYDENASKNLHAEVPFNAQELYKILDSVIQEVLTNENADPQQLLTKACEDFQRDYLDKAK